MAFWDPFIITFEYIVLYGLKDSASLLSLDVPQSHSHLSAPGRPSQTLCSPVQGRERFFCKGPDSTYSGFCRPHLVSAAVTQLYSCSEKTTTAIHVSVFQYM